MGNHVSHGEFARGSDAISQFFVETEVYIHILVCRPIKRTISRRAHATAVRRSLLPIDHQRVRPELQTLVAEDFAPNISHAGMHHLRKLRKLRFLRTDFDRSVLLLYTSNLHLL